MSDEEVQTIAKGFVLPNMQKNTSWALAVFNEWRLARNMKCTTDKCPEELFEERNIGQLTAGSLVSLLKRIGSLTLEKVCISFLPDSRGLCLARSLMLMKFLKCKDPLKFLKCKDPQFRDIHGTCEPSIKNCTSRVLEQTYGTWQSLLLKRRKSSGNWVIGCTTPKNLQ